MNKPTPPRNAPHTGQRPALGRGLDALLRPPAGAAPSTAARPSATAAAAAAAATAGPPAPTASEDTVAVVALSAIQPNPFQPRRYFDPEALAELAASIRSQGVLQPLLVRPQGSMLELIAGERRFRAAQLAGLVRVPVLIRAYSDERSLAVALIENLQRADLNPIEQAQAFLELGQRFRLTQEQIAQQTGKDRATVANCLRLLKLAPEVVELLRQGTLSPGQARPLISLDPEAQAALARQIAEQAWPARRVEAYVQRLSQPPALAPPAPARDPNERDAEHRLAAALGAKVTLKPGRGHGGTIEIRYASLDEFQRLFDFMVKS